MSWNGIKEEKLGDVAVNLTNYIGRGTVTDRVQMSGNAYFLSFEI